MEIIFAEMNISGADTNVQATIDDAIWRKWNNKATDERLLESC